MRRQHWSAPVLGMLLLLAGGRHVLAQFAPPSAGGPSDYTQVKAEAFPRQPYPYHGGPHDHPDGDPHGYGGPFVTDPAAAFGTGYVPTHHQVSVGPVGHAAFQPQFQPYPEISPFMEQQFSQTTNENGLWQNSSNSRGRRYYFDLEYLDVETRKPNDAFLGYDELPPPPAFPTSPELFQPVDISDVLKHDLDTGGIRARFGYWNPDDSGFVMDAWWIAEATARHHRGYNPAPPFEAGELWDTLGVPLFTGAGVITVPYDRYVEVAYETEAYGTSVSWLTTPWLRGGSYRVRPMWGARYMFLRERFGFIGADSALTLLYTDDLTGIPGTEGPNPFGNPAYEAFLDNRIKSHMFGPEIGMHYELGGSKFLIGGYSKVALLGNREKVELRGNNIGDGFGDGFGGLQSLFPADNPFYRREDTWHLSPAFEQNFFVEFPIFGIIPYLNKSWLFEDAKFRASYNFLIVGEVARPEDSFQWNGLPLYPEIDIERSHWFQRSWSVGVHWDF